MIMEKLFKPTFHKVTLSSQLTQPITFKEDVKQSHSYIKSNKFNANSKFTKRIGGSNTSHKPKSKFLI